MGELHHRLYTAVTGLSTSGGAQYIALTEPLDRETERDVQNFLMYLAPRNGVVQGYAAATFPAGLLGFAIIEYSRFEADRRSRANAIHIHMRIAPVGPPGAVLALGDLAMKFPLKELAALPADELYDEYKRCVLQERLGDPPCVLTALSREVAEIENVLTTTLVLHGQRVGRPVRTPVEPAFPQWRQAAAAIAALPISIRGDCRWATGVRLGNPQSIDFVLHHTDTEAIGGFVDAATAAAEYAAFLAQPERTEEEILEIAQRDDIADAQDLSRFLREQGVAMAKPDKTQKTPLAMTDPPPHRVQLSPEVRQELKRQCDEIRRSLDEELIQRLAVLQESLKTPAQQVTDGEEPAEPPSVPSEPPKEPPKERPKWTSRVREWFKRNRSIVIPGGVATFLIIAVLLSALAIMKMSGGLGKKNPDEKKMPATQTNSGGQSAAANATVGTAASTTAAVTERVAGANQRLEMRIKEKPMDFLRLCEKIRDSHGLSTGHASVSDLQKRRFTAIVTKIQNRETLSADEILAIRIGAFEYIVASYNLQREIVVNVSPTEITTQDLNNLKTSLSLDDVSLTNPQNPDFQAFIVEEFLRKQN